MIKVSYDIYLNTPATGVIHAADCVIEEPNGKPERIGFRYRPEYLNHPFAFAIDPSALPLRGGETLISSDVAIPGFLDDYLPDAWGRKVLTRLAYYRDKKRLNANSAIELLNLLGSRRIGALSIVPKGSSPQYELGLPMEHVAKAEWAAQHIDESDFNQVPPEEMSLLYLASSGSGVGGARPKALISENQQHYLAKFNRHADAYNNARVELACLKLAKQAGLNVGEGRVIEGISERETLLLERFDVLNAGASQARAHIISINSLLKDPLTQRDYGFHFSYEAIYKVLQQHSVSIEKDAEQLLLLMLFNRGINNLDDHEKNFSLINNGNGYQLSPAYDLVPQLIRGQYHVAGFQYQPNPPAPSSIGSFGKVFGLSKPMVNDCAEKVTLALREWRMVAEQCGVPEIDANNIQQFINH